MRSFFISIIAAAACAIPAIACAGTTGELTGAVIDASSHSPLAGALVVVRSLSQVEQAVSDAAGQFAFVSLNPGTYTVSASRSGYLTTVYPGILVRADIESTVSMTLSVRARILAILSDHSSAYLVRPDLVMDTYKLSEHSTPFFDFNAGPMNALHFVPGLTFGAGLVIAH